MKKNTILLSVIILTSFTACSKSSSTLKPNSYTNKGYCIVDTPEQMRIGLNRFNTKEEFIKECNGKMLFKFNKQFCRIFTMKDMKFDILIENEKNRYNFKVGEEMTICGETIIESVNIPRKH